MCIRRSNRDPFRKCSCRHPCRPWQWENTRPPARTGRPRCSRTTGNTPRSTLAARALALVAVTEGIGERAVLVRRAGRAGVVGTHSRGCAGGAAGGVARIPAHRRAKAEAVLHARAGGRVVGGKAHARVAQHVCIEAAVSGGTALLAVRRRAMPLGARHANAEQAQRTIVQWLPGIQPPAPRLSQRSIPKAAAAASA